MATVAELIACREQLASVSDSASLDVELLLCHCLGKGRTYLRAWPDAEVDDSVTEQFQQLLARRSQGEPIAYILGETEFRSLPLRTSPATLIPRPETEGLVELALEIITQLNAERVLDLGTGTGAVALALATECPQLHVVACDVQPAAVALAQENRDRLALANVEVLQSDWFSALSGQHFEVIVSNPPYIDPQDPHLQQGDVRFEPATALVADHQGFAAIDAIVASAGQHLVDGGWLLFEHGYNQGEGARERLRAAGYVDVFTQTDLAGHERISGGCWRIADTHPSESH